MSKRVLVPLAEGFEEIEAVTVIDILRRAGIEVVVADLAAQRVVKGRSGITVRADVSWDAALAGGPFDAVVLPGGLPNAFTLRDDPRVLAAVKRTFDEGGIAAAICAAPVALERAGLLEGRDATCHPGMTAELPAPSRNESRVVVDGRVVTSRAPGTAMEFAFALVRLLAGDAAVAEVNAGVLAAL
jgi:protein deglycase